MGSMNAAPEAVYVCIHVPEFPAQARLRFRPEQAREAVAILEGEAPLQQVCSATNKALGLGVAHGMTPTELNVFPGLTVLKRSEPEERAAQAAMLSMASAFTPRTQRATGVAPACAFVLDMTGTTRIFGSAELCASRILQAVQALGLVCRIAVSRNFHAALCMAPFAMRTPIVLHAGREREALASLPLAALSLNDKQKATFELWGLRTLGELAELPEEDLVVRLGQQGKRLRALARGEHPHLMEPEEAGLALEEMIAFDAPVDLLDSLLFVLSPMLEQILARAQAHALSLASLTVKLFLDGGGEHHRTLKPALPLAEREVFLKLLHLDLQAHPPAAGVFGLHLQAEPGYRSKVQAGLFSPQLPEATRLDITLARISALVGEGNVGRARLLDTHRADSFVMERFTISAARATAAPVSPAATLRRQRPPVVLRMILKLSSACKQQPDVFYLEGKRYCVVEAYGPWRKSGDWWTSQIWSSEEWDIHAKTNEGDALLCVIVHDLLRKHWQLEAFYD